MSHFEQAFEQEMRGAVEDIRRDMNRVPAWIGPPPPPPSRLQRVRYAARRKRDAARQAVAQRIAPWLTDDE